MLCLGGRCELEKLKELILSDSIVIGTKRVSGKKKFSQKIGKQSTVLGL